MIRKNETVTVVCERLGSNGEGVAKSGDAVLFVPYLLPGEKASVKALSVKGRVVYGKIEELFTPAEQRVRPVCKVFGKCGGCQLQHLNYRAQLAFKSELVKNTLKKIGRIDVPVERCVPSAKNYGYRNKLILPIGEKNGELAVGFYAERSHRIVETERCPIHPDWVEALIAAVKRFASTCGLDGYNEETGTGQLRHLVVREIDGKCIVVLVSTEREIKGIDFFLSLLNGIFKEYSFFLNVNAEKTNVIFGKEFRLIKGERTYEGEEAGVVFEAGAETFLQVNGGVRSQLYAAAVSLVGENETVVDCYAGGGLMTAMFAKKCKKAYSIEVVKEASECADALKEKNGLSGKMVNLTGRVEDELEAVLKAEPHLALVFDPPRAGVAKSVLSAVLKSGAEKVIVIS